MHDVHDVHVQRFHDSSAERKKAPNLAQSFSLMQETNLEGVPHVKQQSEGGGRREM